MLHTITQLDQGYWETVNLKQSCLNLLMLARELRNDRELFVAGNNLRYYAVPDIRYSSLIAERNVLIAQIPKACTERSRLLMVDYLTQLYSEVA